MVGFVTNEITVMRKVRAGIQSRQTTQVNSSLTDPGVVNAFSPGGASTIVSNVTLSIHVAPNRSGAGGGSTGILNGLYW